MTNDNVLREMLASAKGIAWDPCHKIYVLMTDEQVEKMREYEYDPIHTDLDPQEMYATVMDWWDNSCSLRFIQGVGNAIGGGNEADFYSIVPQGENLFDRAEVDA